MLFTQLSPSVCKLDDRAKSSPLFPLLLHAMDGDALFPPLIIALYNLEKWTPVLQQPCSEYLSLLFNSRSGHFSSQIISPGRVSPSRGIYRRNSGGHDRRFLSFCGHFQFGSLYVLRTHCVVESGGRFPGLPQLFALGVAYNQAC